MLGLGFLFSAIQIPLSHHRASPSKITAVAFVAVITLGLVSGVFSRAQRDAQPENLEAAGIEVESLSLDFKNGLALSKCNLHKRLYTFVQEYDQPGLLTGSYSGLQSQGLPKERAEFFRDPWNSPYWISDRCDRQTNRRITFIYSFGPDRQRDSSRTEILGDDIGSIW